MPSTLLYLKTKRTELVDFASTLHDRIEAGWLPAKQLSS
jgi:hypothetical protein